MDAIAVITLSRKRPTLLKRAMASVHAQDYAGVIEHRIVIDNCEETAAALRGIASSPKRKVVVHFEARPAGQEVESGKRLDLVYPRLARLLNMASRMTKARWIAFLDDDNEYEPNHLSSLMSWALRYNCSAVHSFRQVLNADSSPYLDYRFPWARDPDDADRIYELLCSRGIWIRGSNVLKDTAGPQGIGPFKNSTIMSSRDPIFMVDTSVWLLKRDLLLQYPIPEVFSDEDLRDNAAPDDKLLELLLLNNVRIITSGLPTLRYYLGGISNPTGHA